jgi:NADH-quinone oxidoreductase subunit C
MTNETIRQRLTEQFGEQLTDWEEPFGLLTFNAPAANSLDIVRFMFDDDQLQFQFLTDLTAVHYPERKGAEFTVVYLLHNMVANIRVRTKVNIPLENPEVASLTGIFSAANWLEREAYDFFGILFEGHPNLIRIMNPDEMDYFPMRKEFPMEDPTRTDKDDNMFGR